jgi:hypothetical protein
MLYSHTTLVSVWEKWLSRLFSKRPNSKSISVIGCKTVSGGSPRTFSLIAKIMINLYDF